MPGTPLGSKKCFTTGTTVTNPQMGSGNTAQVRTNEHNFAKIYEGHSSISFDSNEKLQSSVAPQLPASPSQRSVAPEESLVLRPATEVFAGSAQPTTTISLLPRHIM